MQAEPVAMFAVADKFAVMYSTSRSFRTGYATFHVSVFDKEGHQISSNIVGKVMPETLVSATISNTLQVDMKTWRIEWKKDYGTNGLDGNKIKGLTHVETATVDLTKPTPKRPSRFEEMIAPPLLEPSPAEPEGIKSK